MHASFEWDDPPPLHPADDVYYTTLIIPAVVRLVQEFRERLGGVLYVRA